MDVVASRAHDVTCPKSSLCQGAGRAERVGWSLGESSAYRPKEPWAVVLARTSRGPPHLAPLSRARFSSKQGAGFLLAHLFPVNYPAKARGIFATASTSLHFLKRKKNKLVH